MPSRYIAIKLSIIPIQADFDIFSFNMIQLNNTTERILNILVNGKKNADLNLVI